ncbi:MAG: hypothetical protein M3N52_00790 [Actinomycetota bacterium]|nr:hypothetical protein [Actinomycetota bacterium]
MQTGSRPWERTAQAVGRLMEQGVPGRVEPLRELASAIREDLGRAPLRQAAEAIPELVVAVAQRLPVRDATTLSRQHAGANGDELAEQLITASARASATLGGLAGALSAVPAVTLARSVTVPAVLAAEAVLVAALELKLTAELHEVYGQALPGDTNAERIEGLLAAWATHQPADRRVRQPGDLVSLLPESTKHAVRAALRRRLRCSTATLLPFLVGGVAGGALNGRQTRRVGTDLRSKLSASRGSL